MEPANGITRNESEPSDAIIYCVYSANPSELQPFASTSSSQQLLFGKLQQSNSQLVRWFKDGKHMQFSGDNYEDIVTGTKYVSSFTSNKLPMLTILSPNRHSSGKYSCQVSNYIGSSELLSTNEMCELVVNFVPTTSVKILSLDSLNLLDYHHSDKGIEQSKLEQLDNEGKLRVVEVSSEILTRGSRLVLACELVSGMPREINSYRWYTKPSLGTRINSTNSVNDGSQKDGSWQLVAHSASVGKYLELEPLEDNYGDKLFACSAVNEAGLGQPSNSSIVGVSKLPGKYQELLSEMLFVESIFCGKLMLVSQKQNKQTNEL